MKHHKEVISANALFHFTDNFDNLVNILRMGFFPQFCQEDFTEVFGLTPDGRRRIYALPMVCFTDIPLSHMKSHIGTYGNYGVGFSKDWARNNSINPVLYTEKNFKTAALIQRILTAAASALDNLPPDQELPPRPELYDILASSNRLTNFIKPYSSEETRYYDEREWRYIPEIDSDEVPSVLFVQDMDECAMTEANELMSKKYRLAFTPGDIKYIIVEHDEEIPPLIQAIKEIFGGAFTPDELMLFATKILTVSRMREDF